MSGVSGDVCPAATRAAADASSNSSASHADLGGRIELLSNGFLIRGLATHDQMCDVALRVLDELESGWRRRRHELRLRLRDQRQLRLVEPLDEQQIVNRSDG